MRESERERGREKEGERESGREKPLFSKALCECYLQVVHSFSSLGHWRWWNTQLGLFPEKESSGSSNLDGAYKNQVLKTSEKGENARMLFVGKVSCSDFS